MYLAATDDRLATIEEISTAYAISENHLMKVVHQLSKNGVIASVRGKGGGIRLARAPEEIFVGVIVRRCEGTAPIVECLGLPPSACRIAGICKLESVLVDAFDALYAVLDRYTLADLVPQPQPLLIALGKKK